MNTIFNSHDRFFRQSLSDLSIAKDFFATHLPSKILAIVDLNSLKICKESYIDPALKECIDDIVYQVNLKAYNNSIMYFALEHQSTSKRLMAFRFIKYQLAIIDNHLKQHPNSKELPLVFPLLYYHGTKTPYPATTDLFDLFIDKNLAKEFLLNPIQIIDINKFSDQEIITHKLAGLFELVQKHIYDKDFLLSTNGLKELIIEIATTTDLEHLMVYLNNTIYYIMKNAEISDKIKFKKILSEIPWIKGDRIMTTMAEEWINEGFQQGMQEGIKLAAIKMLQAGISDSNIEKITGLTSIDIKNLTIQLNLPQD